MAALVTARRGKVAADHPVDPVGLGSLRDDSGVRQALVSAIDRAVLDRCAARVPAHRVADGDAMLEGVARAAASSPAAQHVPGTFVVRRGPNPALAVVGELDPAAVDRVASLFEHVDSTFASLRYVDYPQAERDAEVLADRLQARLGRGWLDEARFVAIPRGGHIVLGLLAMVLGLRRDQLAEPDPAQPLVIVDDVILTGHRLAGWLQETAGEDVAVATLYAHPDACRTVETAFEPVRACVTAQDLEDLGPQRWGAAYDEWRATWRRDLDPPRLWVGLPEAIAFAWKEPDHTIWNAVTQQREHGWRVLPRTLCLAGPSEPVPADRVQLQPTPVGPWTPSPTVVTAELDGQLVIADPQTATTLVLDDVAALMWRALVAHGRPEAAAAAVERHVDAPADVVGADLRSFVDELDRRSIAAT